MDRFIKERKKYNFLELITKRNFTLTKVNDVLDRVLFGIIAEQNKENSRFVE